MIAMLVCFNTGNGDSDSVLVVILVCFSAGSRDTRSVLIAILVCYSVGSGVLILVDRNTGLFQFRKREY